MSGNKVQCECRKQLKKQTKQCKRKRQAFVFNPEDEIWHEPYMQTLRREFSEESVLCDSKIELPWRDIALPHGMKIRPDITYESTQDIDEALIEIDKAEKKDYDGTMTLPWKDLLITETVQSKEEPEISESLMQIPWSDIALEKPMEIRPPKEKKDCDCENIEIPWDEILVPRNIIIKSDKKKKYP